MRDTLWGGLVYTYTEGRSRDTSEQSATTLPLDSNQGFAAPISIRSARRPQYDMVGVESGHTSCIESHQHAQLQAVTSLQYGSGPSEA